MSLADCEDDYERLARDAAAREREACARICDEAGFAEVCGPFKPFPFSCFGAWDDADKDPALMDAWENGDVAAIAARAAETDTQAARERRQCLTKGFALAAKIRARGKA